MAYNSAYTGSQIDEAVGAVRNKEEIWDGKQDKITGMQGQVVGFDEDGDPVAQPAPDTGVTTFNGRTGAVSPQNGDYTAEMVGAIPATQKGAVSGVAELDSTGRVPSTQLPSYVDDVVDSYVVGSTPLAADWLSNTSGGAALTPETGKIYLVVSDGEYQNREYRWSGSQYAQLSPGVVLGETSSTAYRGDRGKVAYDHSQTTGNPHGTTAADVGAIANPTGGTTGQILEKTETGTQWTDKPASGMTQTEADARYLQLDGGSFSEGANVFIPGSAMLLFGGSPINPNASLYSDSYGALRVSNSRISGVEDPVEDTDAANKSYVDSKLPLLRTATLTTSGWSSNSQTVTVNGVLADESLQEINLAFGSKESAPIWAAAGCWCSAQGANSLTFTCDAVPTGDISLRISIKEAQS